MSDSHVEGRREIGPGRSAYWQAWLPPEQVRGVVVISHGLAEHSGRYAHVGARLAAAGFAAYAADHRGHGRTQGSRANLERMALVVDDLGAFVRLATGRHPGVPVFLLGHSFGGLVALQYATDPGCPLDGLVLSAPAVEAMVGSALERRLAGVLSALVPGLPVAALNAEVKISRDPEVIRAYRDDPLVYRGRIKARTGAEALATMQALPTRLPRLSVPLLILHGTGDLICALSGSTMVHDTVSSADKTLRHYPDLYHEIFNEPEQDEVLTDLLTWLEAHLSPQSA